MADIPNIPALGSKIDPDIRRAFRALKAFFEAVRAEGGFATASSASTITDSDIVDVIDDTLPGQTDLTTPPIPEGLTATGAFNKVILEWGGVDYNYHAYTQIWRAAVDDFGSAAMVGTARGVIYADTPPDSSLASTYYYWVRFVSQANVAGPINATAGTAASLADDPEYLLELAAEKWQASHYYEVGEFVIPTIPNGFVYEMVVDGGLSGSTEPTWPTTVGLTVIDGDIEWKCSAVFSFETFFKIALVGGVPKLTLKELFLADGIIKNAMIANLAVDNAKISDLSAAKIIAGIIAASNIFLGASAQIHLDGVNERITVKDASDVTRVVLGKLTSGWGIEIFDASGNTILNSGGVPVGMVSGIGAFALVDQITEANISTYMETAAIKEAYIANAAVSTLKIQDNAVTVPVYAENDAIMYLKDYYQNVLSATIDSEGQPIHVFFSSFHKNVTTAGQTCDVYLRVICNGETIKTSLVSSQGGASSFRGVAVILSEIAAPALGVATVTIQARKNYSSPIATLQYRTLLLQGIKR